MNWSEFLLAHEPAVRIGCFFGVFLAVALWEILRPCRRRAHSRRQRWRANLGLALISTATLRLLFPAAAVGMAMLAERQAWGLLNTLDLPPVAAGFCTIIALDVVIFFQHRLFHAVPWLWRIHRVHHADTDFDVTTGIRFHPLEAVLSMLIKFAAIAALGPPVIAVLLFEVLLNVTSVFNHGNVRIARGFERMLRWLVVTPDMHRIHHSTAPVEANRNFGFNLSWWDRLFGTYLERPQNGHACMTVGLAGQRNPALATRLPAMLWLPFSVDAERVSVAPGDAADSQRPAAPSHSAAVATRPAPAPARPRFRP